MFDLTIPPKTENAAALAALKTLADSQYPKPVKEAVARLALAGWVGGVAEPSTAALFRACDAAESALAGGAAKDAAGAITHALHSAGLIVGGGDPDAVLAVHGLVVGVLGGQPVQFVAWPEPPAQAVKPGAKQAAKDVVPALQPGAEAFDLDAAYPTIRGMGRAVADVLKKVRPGAYAKYRKMKYGKSKDPDTTTRATAYAFLLAEYVKLLAGQNK